MNAFQHQMLSIAADRARKLSRSVRAARALRFTHAHTKDGGSIDVATLNQIMAAFGLVNLTRHP